MAGSAAALAAVPVVGLGKSEGPSELAGLIRRYWVEWNAFPNGASDDEINAYVAATFRATEDAMIGVPARTAEDALAALDFLIRESEDFELDLSDDEGLHGSLIGAVRDYIARQVA